MNVLITGGAGYIGKYIVDLLLQRGFKVVIIDNFSNSISENVNDKAKLYTGDICIEEHLKTVFKENNIDLVIHLAGNKNVSESVNKPLKYYYNNVEGTRMLLKQMKINNVNNIIFSSSASVYGNNEGLANEDTKTNPITPYASTKLVGEEIIKYSGLNYIIFRYFNVAGGKQDGDSLIANIKNCDVVQIYGNDYKTNDGTCIRDFIHVEDIAEAHLLAIKYIMNSGKSGIFNLGSETYSVLEVVNESKKKYIFCEKRSGDIEISICDNSKAEKYLGWKPKKKLKDMLKEN